MSEVPRRGEIWWAEVEDGRRPVLVVTRSEAIPVLNAILVAPVTRTVRGIRTEIRLGLLHGLRAECCASFDNLQRVPPRLLTDRIGQLEADETQEICRALDALADC